MATPKPSVLHFSISQLKTYLRCPKQYQLKYVLGVVPAFMPRPLAFGAAIHQALAHHYTHIQENQTIPSLESLIEIFTDAWKWFATSELPLQEAGPDERDPLELAANMLRAFHLAAKEEPLPKVLLVEHPFTVPLYDPATGELLEETMAGTFDLVVEEDGLPVIVENKTSARRYSEDQIKFDVQLSGYKYAAIELGLGAQTDLRFQIITKAKLPDVLLADAPRGPRDIDVFLETAVGVLRALEAGIFYPLPGWACRSCAFSNACPAMAP